MYCIHCGCENNDDARFCVKCGRNIGQEGEGHGQLIQEESQQMNFNYSGQGVKKKKNNTAIIISSAIVLLVLIMSIFIVANDAILSKKHKELKAEIKEDNVAECILQVSDLDEEWKDAGIFSFSTKKEINNKLVEVGKQSKEYIKALEEAQAYVTIAQENLKKYDFANKEHKKYEKEVTNLEEILSKREGSKLKEELDKTEECYQNWIDASNVSIEKRLEEYEDVNLSTADKSDKDSIENAISSIRDLLGEDDIEYDAIAKIFEDTEDVLLKYVESDNVLNMEVQQIDVTNYPNVKLYVNVTDEYNNVVDNLDSGMFFLRKQDASGNFIKQQVKSARQLNEVEALSINMLADISGSMAGYPLNDAKNIMNSFVDSVQFAVGDTVALTSFSDGVYFEHDFSSSAVSLKNAINNLYAMNMTAFYDALYTSVDTVAARSGARCVIAFTDGMDTSSSCTPEQVIALAQRYHVPIFIIGIGAEDYSIAKNIAEKTGGYYYNAATVADMNSIYSQIYRKEKELYMIEFEDTSNVNIFAQSNIVTGYHTTQYGGETSYSYTPNTLVSVKENNIFKTGPESVVASYMISFADAMTNKDYSYIKPYILSGSALEQEQVKYVQRGIDETLSTYEIENVEYIDANNCVVTTRETYYVKKVNEPISLLTQRCKYNVVLTGNEWKLTSFADEIEIVSRIKV